jgi:hypothetical protein
MENEFLQKAKDVYGEYGTGRLAISNEGAIFSNDPRTIYTLRAHARGVQDVSKYQDEIDPLTAVKSDGRIEHVRKMKISWKPVRILSKFRSLAVDKIVNILLIPKTEAVDEMARFGKKLLENRMKLIRNQASQAVLPNSDEFKDIETVEDVEYISKMGGLRLPVEFMMKDAIDITLYRSKFEAIAKMLAEDIVDVNAAATHQHTVNGQEIIEYVDVARVITRPSIYPDFRDSDIRGFISTKTANQIIVEAKFEDEDIINKICELDETKFIPRKDRTDWQGRRENFSNNEGDLLSFGVDVMTLYYLEKVTKKFISGKRKDNTTQFEPVDNNFKLTTRMKNKGKELVEVPIMELKKVNWVIGTEITYGEGVVDTIVREGQKGNKSIVWPLTIIAGHEPSLISRCIEFDDDLQIANFTMRNIYATIPPAPRMIIFANLIKDSVNIGGQEYSIMDLITNYQSTGVMVLEGHEYNNSPDDYNQQQQSPIQFIESGVSEDLIQLQHRMMQSVGFH